MIYRIMEKKLKDRNDDAVEDRRSSRTSKNGVLYRIMERLKDKTYDATEKDEVVKEVEMVLYVCSLGRWGRCVQFDSPARCLC